MTETQAIGYGPEVLDLVKARRGRVLAVLSNCIYLESSAGYVVAVVGEDSADGPLTLRVPNLGVLLESVREHQDLSWQASERHVEIGGQVTISLCGAQGWEPVIPGRLGSEAAREESANELGEALAGSAPDGRSATAYALELANVVCRGHFDGDSPASLEPQPAAPSMLISRRLAVGIIEFMEAWHSCDADGAGSALVSLLGLGEGLTPSGDDAVSGILAALVWHARLGLISLSAADGLAELVRQVPSRTNRISARLLHYASRGILYSPAMELGAALLGGDARGVGVPARHLFAIGNTTGIDLAAGLLVGCWSLTTIKTEGPLARASARGRS